MNELSCKILEILKNQLQRRSTTLIG